MPQLFFKFRYLLIFQNTLKNKQTYHGIKFGQKCLKNFLLMLTFMYRGVISRKILVLLKVNDIFLKWKFWPNYSSEFWYWCCLSSLRNEGVTPLHIYIHTTYRQWLTTLCLTSHSHQGLNHILLQFAYKRKNCGLKKYK